VRKSLMKEIVLGTGAAYVATKVMDWITTVFLEQQSEASKRREKELQEEPAYVKAAEKLADLRGTQVDKQEAEQIGQRVHMGLGLSGGPVAGFLAARGMNPLRAGVITGLGMWVLVDEGANAVFGLTPPPPAYPREAHLRGLVGHLTYGAVLGALLGIGNALFSGNRSLPTSS
jgi:hypothetical protein